MHKPSILERIIAVFVGAIAATHAVQAILGARGEQDPRALVAEHIVVSITGLVAAYALWRGERWGSFFLSANGILIAALIVSLGPLLQMDAAARRGLWTGAASIMVMTAVAVWYVRPRARAVRLTGTAAVTKDDRDGAGGGVGESRMDSA